MKLSMKRAGMDESDGKSRSISINTKAEKRSEIIIFSDVAVAVCVCVKSYSINFSFHQNRIEFDEQSKSIRRALLSGSARLAIKLENSNTIADKRTST